MATTNYATSSYKTALLYSEDGKSFSKLVSITSTPDLGGTPDRLEITPLDVKAHTYINGLQGGEEGLDFTANYTLEDYKKLLALEGKTLHYAVYYDDGTDLNDDYTPEGELGRWKWVGQLSVYPNGVEANAVRTMTISISITEPIEFEDPTEE